MPATAGTTQGAILQSPQPIVIVNVPPQQGDKGIVETLARLNDRLSQPIGAVVTVSGDQGIARAQDEYDNLMRNKSPKSRKFEVTNCDLKLYLFLDVDFAGAGCFWPLAAAPEFAAGVDAGFDHALHHHCSAFGTARGRPSGRLSLSKKIIHILNLRQMAKQITSTPLMKQYEENVCKVSAESSSLELCRTAATFMQMKRKHPDAVLLFRVGELATPKLGCARHNFQAILKFCSRLHEQSTKLSARTL